MSVLLRQQVLSVWKPSTLPNSRRPVNVPAEPLADTPGISYNAWIVSSDFPLVEEVSMTLEQELIDIFAATAPQRNREILIGYYGWDDGRQHTLTEIGARFGITRERVRQVCAKLTKRHKTPSALPAPAMDRALELIAERLPCSAAQIEAELAEQGLTAIDASLDRIAAGARLLGRPVQFKVVRIEDEKKGGMYSTCRNGTTADDRLVIHPNQLAAVLAAVDLAKKEVYFHGLATVERIAQAISAEREKGTGPSCAKHPWGEHRPKVGHGKLDLSPSPAGEAGRELVRQTLMLMDGFCWLDEPTGWFRLSGVHKHGLPKAIDKALAVAGQVTASQLAVALARNRRLWKEPPPEKVLLAFCRQMPRVCVEGDRIISDPPRDWRKALTGVEAKLVEVLLAHGPVLERSAMEDLCVADGMNRFSFHAFISWSPVIAQYGHSLYGLLGTKVSRQQVERLLAERRAKRHNRRVLDRHGRTDDGRVWLSYRLSKAASTYAVITIPAALKKIVRGRFQLVAPDGRAIGTLATKDGRAWGLGAFLREQSARIGDHIILTLDLIQRTAVASWDGGGEDRRMKDEG
jgi:hypothetical protein